jgi:shikimate dehydrogenase
MGWTDSMEAKVFMDKKHLEELRIQIDKIDKELSFLLQKRFNLVEQIAEYKAQFNMDVLDKSRENKVIEKVLSKVENPNYSKAIKLVYETIMDASKNYQHGRIKSIENMPQKRYAVIGRRLSHSLSPKIHNIFFRKTGIAANYDQITLEPEELPELLNKLNDRGYKGINVTIPYKTEIMKSLDYVSPIAERIGAVNTVEIGEQFKGYNTDYYGFGRALDYYGFKSRDQRCAVLGSGGSARAICAYLEDNGASEIAIISRKPADASLKFPGYKTISINDYTSENFDLIVNCTPVGMYPDQEVSPISKEQLKGAAYVMDLIYNPYETLLLKYAKELVIPYANGLYMLVSQAISAQEIWQGLSYEQDIVNYVFDALEKELS